MRLSETKLSTVRRPQRPDLEGPTKPGRRKVFISKTSIALALLVALVGAAIGAVAFGRQMATQAAGDPNPDCTLILPRNPLSAQGLATPFQLTATDPNQGPCNQANPDQAAFAEAAVLDPATGKISIYHPLVIDKGTQPAAAPVVPKLPRSAIVALWFGSNGDTLRLKGGAGANCVNGLGNSVFGQYSYCNAPLFFLVANRLIRDGKITIPAIGTGNDGLPCPTSRDFSVVDQDQSDNVLTTYLITKGGQVAQDTAANRAKLPDAQVQVNGSDERLLAVGLDRALGCTPWMAPDLTDNGAMVPALALNELQAARYQQAPVALTPLGDPMVLVDGKESLAKTNLYRLGVNQTPARTRQQADTRTYCQNMLDIAPARMQKDMQFTITQPSPDPAAANNLFTFLAQRFNDSYGPDNLNCATLLNQDSPITTEMDENGVTISATINLNGDGGNGGDGGGGDGGGGGGGGGGDGGQGNTPTCVINGVTVENCAGTTTITVTCQVTYDADTNQIIIDCPGK